MHFLTEALLTKNLKKEFLFETVQKAFKSIDSRVQLHTYVGKLKISSTTLLIWYADVLTEYSLVLYLNTYRIFMCRTNAMV